VLRFVLSAMLHLRKLFADGRQTSSWCEMLTDFLELKDGFFFVCSVYAVAKLVCVVLLLILVVVLAPV